MTARLPLPAKRMDASEACTQPEFLGWIGCRLRLARVCLDAQLLGPMSFAGR